MSGKLEELISEIQSNLKQVIRIADEISQEFRRTIHVDMTSKKTGRNVKLLRQLLETDNLMRDTIAQLRKATSSINFKSDQSEILQDEVFLKELYQNLTQMFKSFDSIYKVMKFDQSKVDSLVIDTINSLDRLSNF